MKLAGTACLDIKVILGRTTLHYAGFTGNSEELEDLIKSDASTEVKDNDGKTPSDLAGSAVDEKNRNPVEMR